VADLLRSNHPAPDEAENQASNDKSCSKDTEIDNIRREFEEDVGIPRDYCLIDTNDVGGQVRDARTRAALDEEVARSGWAAEDVQAAVHRSIGSIIPNSEVRELGDMSESLRTRPNST